MSVIESGITLKAEVRELDALLDWVGGLLDEGGCPGRACNQVAVVTEELFVNIASYAYGSGGGQARITFRLEDGLLVMRFEDTGIPFNPLEYQTPDLTAAVEDRKVGGLGIYLTRKWMDTMSYERRDGRNILTVTKTVGGEAATDGQPPRQ